MTKLAGKDKELADKINALLAEYGYKSNRYFVSHNAHEARFTINTTKIVKDADGNVDLFAKAKSEFRTYHNIVGFKPEWLGKTFKYGNKTFTFQGLDMGKTKNTCVITDANGKRFVAPGDAVKFAIERSVA